MTKFVATCEVVYESGTKKLHLTLVTTFSGKYEFETACQSITDKVIEMSGTQKRSTCTTIFYNILCHTAWYERCQISKLSLLTILVK